MAACHESGITLTPNATPENPRTASDTPRRLWFDPHEQEGNSIPPDDTEGLEEADLPGLGEADSSELVEADLPGLDDDSPSLESEVPTEQAGTDAPSSDGVSDAVQEARDLAEAATLSRVHPTWTDAELDKWFEIDFGGSAALDDVFGMDETDFIGRVDRHDDPDLFNSLLAYKDLEEGGVGFETVSNPWRVLSHGTKLQFRRGWEQKYGDLLPDQVLSGSLPDGDPEGDAGDLQQVVLGDVDYEQRHKPTKPSLPRSIFVGVASKLSLPQWIVVGGGVIGLVLAVGFILSSGSDDADNDAAVALPSDTPAVVVDAEAPVAALDAPVVAVAPPTPFPNVWLFTATKTADLVLIPDSMDTGDVGIQLDLYVMVTETCTGDACVYTSVVERLDRFAPLIGTIPEATWVIDGTEWSLDAEWQAGPSECVQDHHFTYEFTVTETELIDGRTVPASFTGTWLQRGTGPCNGGWEHVAEWSVAGTAASS